MGLIYRRLCKMNIGGGGVQEWGFSDLWSYVRETWKKGSFNRNPEVYSN